MVTDIDSGQLCVRDFDPLGVFLFIELGTHGEARIGCRGRYELDDRAETAQGLATPVDRDEGKEPMLDFVPLAGPGRQMTYRNGKLEFVSQFL